MNEINENKIIELANECFGCPTKPCQKGCPLENDTTGFIALVKEQKYKEAFELLSNTTVFMPICGRVCPHTRQCQGKCIRAIKSDAVKIGNMEAFIGDLALKNNWKFPVAEEEKDYKVAIVGGGPAGLTCAQFLRRAGIQVTIFEKYNYLGGILNHGIPQFRLDKVMLNKWIDKILESGIKIEYGKELGLNVLISELEQNFDKVVLALGANVSTKMGIPGEDLDGVYGGNEFLEKTPTIDVKGKTIVVSGGGNVAMDVSRSIKRSGAKHVYVVYRRSEKEMPAEQKEIEEARADGVEFLFQNNILQVIGENKVEAIECIKTELVQKEGDSRLSPVNIEGSNYNIKCDYVMMAIGSKAEESVVSKIGVELDRKGKIIVDESGKTSNKNMYACGDIANNMGTVAYAARAGRNVAGAILQEL